MNSLVSLIAPAAGHGAEAPNAPQFPGSGRRSENSTSFSASLDRAVRHAPERPNASARPGRSRTNQNDAAGETDVRNERREPAREKSKGHRDNEQSLAGACAVNGQTITPEASRQPTTEIARHNAAQSFATSNGESESSVSADAAMTTALSSAEGEMQTDGEAPLPKAATTPAAEATTLLKPITTAVELPQRSLLTAEAGLTEPEGPNTQTGLPEQTVTEMSSAIAAALGMDAAAPDDASAPSGLTTAVGIEVAKEIAPAADEARRVSRAARRSLADALEHARGIGGAKSTEMMKTAINKEEIAGSGQQLLPGSSALPGGTLTNLPGESRLGVPGGVSADAANAAAKLAPAPTRADVSGTGELQDSRPASTLVRTGELISREVRMFKRAADDLVEVVLTPDSKTQISLRLQWREGQVEVQARCDLGDHQGLNQQWPQLQAAMAQHGVRLSHLNERAPTGFTEFFNNPSFSQQQGGEGRPSANSSGAESAMPTAPQPARSGAARSGGHGSRLLESWA